MTSKVLYFFLCFLSVFTFACKNADESPSVVLNPLAEENGALQEISYLFSDVPPENWEFHQTKIKGGKLTLAQDENGDNYSEGYVDIPIDAIDFTDGNIRLEATRLNSLEHADFEDNPTITLDENLRNCSSAHAICTPSKAGVWMSNIHPYKMPVVTTDSMNTSNHVAQVSYATGALLQYFPVAPDENYKLTFDIDATGLYQNYDYSDYSAIETQVVGFSLAMADADFKQLQMAEPIYLNMTNNEVLVTTKMPLGRYQSDDGRGRKTIRFKTLECQDHTIYEAGSVVTQKDFIINYCHVMTGYTKGASLKKTDVNGAVLEAYDESDIKYAAILFTPANVGTGSMTVDNLFLDREDQIQIDLLDSQEEALQSSMLDKGFRVTAKNSKKIRLRLKSHFSDRSPTISALHINSNPLLSVTPGEAVAHYSEERIGFSGGIPPTDEWVDYASPVRSLCRDYISGEKKDCQDFFSEHGLKYRRAAAPTVVLEKNKTGTDYDLSFHSGSLMEWASRHVKTADVDSGDLMIDVTNPYFRMGENYYKDYCGAERDNLITKPSALAAARDPDRITCCDNDGNYQVDKWTAFRYCSLINFVDLNRVKRDEVAQGKYLLKKYAGYVAEQFDGQHTFEYSGETYKFPQVKFFEIVEEINKSAFLIDPIPVPTLWAELSQDEFYEYINDIADMIHEAAPNVPTSSPQILSKRNYRKALIDVGYLEDVLGDKWSGTSFDYLNLHPYLVLPYMPEDLKEYSDRAVTVMNERGWENHDYVVTEWGVTKGLYDPYCSLYDSVVDASFEYDSTQTQILPWTHGYGEGEMAKLVARELLITLSMPVRYMTYYALFAGDIDAWGYTIANPYKCWQVDHKHNFNIINRVSGSGILSGKDEPTEYEFPESGQGYFTIAKELSLSDPYESSLSLDKKDKLDTEHYYSTFYKTPTDYVMALWWYPDYVYGNLKNYQLFTYGSMENGFTETRNHDVALNGFKNIKSVTLIEMNGREKRVDVACRDGVSVISNLELGGKPILLRIDGELLPKNEEAISCTEISPTITKVPAAAGGGCRLKIP